MNKEFDEMIESYRLTSKCLLVDVATEAYKLALADAYQLVLDLGNSDFDYVAKRIRELGDEL